MRPEPAQPHALYGRAPSPLVQIREPSTSVPLLDGTSFAPKTPEGRRAVRSMMLRQQQDYRDVVGNNRSVLDGGGMPLTMTIPDSAMTPDRRDEIQQALAGRYRARQAARTAGLLPQAVRRQLITARAQGRRITPAEAQLEQRDPITAAILGRAPEALAIGSRDGAARALGALLGGVARADNPAGAVDAVVRLLGLLGLGGADDGGRDDAR